VTVSNSGFSPPVVAPDNHSQRNCGVGYWAGAQGEGAVIQGGRDIVAQYCGYADVNGDGLVDRIERTTVSLQGGDGSFGVATLQLPSFMQGHTDTTRYQCCNDPNSPCSGGDQRAPQGILSYVDQIFGLKDLNGDGIPDYVSYGSFDSNGPHFLLRDPFAQLTPVLASVDPRT
jgi:hypothetical protein